MFIQICTQKEIIFSIEDIVALIGDKCKGLTDGNNQFMPILSGMLMHLFS